MSGGPARTDCLLSPHLCRGDNVQPGPLTEPGHLPRGCSSSLAPAAFSFGRR